MKAKSIHLYVAAVWVLALATVPLLDWEAFLTLPVPALGEFAALILLGLLSEGLAMSFSVGKGMGSMSIIFIPGVACVLLFGPASVVAFLAVTAGMGEFFFRRKPFIRASFNVAQYLVSAAVAGMVFAAVGGEAIALDPVRDPSTPFDPQLVPFFAYGVVLIGLNHVLVPPAIALSQGLPLRQVLSVTLGSSGGNVLYDLLVSPIAIVIAFLYAELGLPGLILILLPLLFIRHSYLTNYKLQQANRDLLQALVKAIETRDPYTSGHSVRVARLAKRIAHAIGLSSRRIDAIETAALLHDIGKIEGVYSEILKKPSSLTSEEREVIESHTIKGEELLKSLSSFKSDVTGPVRHHHERIDGKGYPDGLTGEDIPLGARIIKVCDAIDAMLSDRPYRRALSMESVREQLRIHAGTQFDESIAEAILEKGLLPEYAVEMERLGTASSPDNGLSQSDRDAQLIAR